VPAGTCTNPATCVQIRSSLLKLPAGGGITFRELRAATGIANGTLGRHLKQPRARHTAASVHAGTIRGRRP